MDKPSLLWGGRFRTGPSPELMRLSRSDASHFRLVPYDIASSLAHGNELARAGIVSDGENAEIAAALGQIAADVAAGRALPTERDEDVHTFIERLLTERLGGLGGKLRAGRSRNDQAANDLKLYLRDEARHLALNVLALQDAIAGQARAAWRDAGARLHPSAAGPAGHLRASASRPCPGRSSATSTACATGTGAAPARRSAPPRWPARRSLSSPSFRRPSSATTRPARTRSTRSAAATMSPSSSSSPPCSRVASLAPRRGGLPMVVAPVRLGRARRRLFDRLLDHAAEEEPRHRRADARARRPPDRRADHHAERAQGPALRL